MVGFEQKETEVTEKLCYLGFLLFNSQDCLVAANWPRHRSGRNSVGVICHFMIGRVWLPLAGSALLRSGKQSD
jgi:hypothetical protein